MVRLQLLAEHARGRHRHQLGHLAFQVAQQTLALLPGLFASFGADALGLLARLRDDLGLLSLGALLRLRQNAGRLLGWLIRTATPVTGSVSKASAIR